MKFSFHLAEEHTWHDSMENFLPEGLCDVGLLALSEPPSMSYHHCYVLIVRQNDSALLHDDCTFVEADDMRVRQGKEMGP